MEDTDVETAVALARETVGVDKSVPAKSFRVRRLDRDNTYVLVQLGQPEEPGWVVAVDVDQRDVMTWAENESGESTVPTRRPPALASGEAEWVWRPSRSSPSPLYPLLRISNDEEEWFMDLAGEVSTTLSDGRA
jgi:transposase